MFCRISGRPRPKLPPLVSHLHPFLSNISRRKVHKKDLYLVFSKYMDFFGEGNGTPLQYSCLENPMDGGAWKAAVHGVAEHRTRLSNFTFTFHFHALEKEMATHSSVLAWRIPGTGEPGGLPSMGSHSRAKTLDVVLPSLASMGPLAWPQLRGYSL